MEKEKEEEEKKKKQYQVIITIITKNDQDNGDIHFGVNILRSISIIWVKFKVNTLKLTSMSHSMISLVFFLQAVHRTEREKTDNII